jgi:hypothetical protein
MRCVVLSVFLAAALTIPSTAVPANGDYRIIRPQAITERFVRIYSDVVINGTHGTEISTIDLVRGFSAQYISAGLLSQGSGFDGSRVWSTDATGMPLLEGNGTVRAAAFVRAHFFGRAGGDRFSVRRLARRGGAARAQLQFAAVPGPIDIAYTKAARRIAEIDDRSIPDRPETMRFSDYRMFAHVELPVLTETTDREDHLVERVKTGGNTQDDRPVNVCAARATR